MDLTVFTAVLTPVILGLVQVAKGIGLTERFAPILAIVVGLAFTALGSVTGNVVENDGSRVDAFMVAITGIIAGLSASGLWSGTKAVTKT